MTILVIFLYEKKKITVVLSGSIRLMVTPVSYSDTFFIKFWITYVYWKWQYNCTKDSWGVFSQIGRGRKRKTSVHLDRVIQRKIKVNRRKSASSVKAEIEIEASFKGRVAWKKPYVDKANRGKELSMPKRIVKSLSATGIKSYGLTKAFLCSLTINVIQCYNLNT
jgi:hypothetical protein